MFQYPMPKAGTPSDLRALAIASLKDIDLSSSIRPKNIINMSTVTWY